MPEQLWFTKILNHAFAGPVSALLTALHIPPQYPRAPISNSFAMEVLVVLILLGLFVLVRARLSVESPSGLQHTFEAFENFIQNQSDEVIGQHSEGYTAFLVALGYFILFCNLLGIVPGFESPTAIPIVPLGCAIATFVYYHVQGFKHSGIAYIKHFAGPMPALAPLMFPIEIISHIARVLSLTIRLFANMYAGDLVTLVFFSLVPVVFPIVFMGLHIFVSVLQTYVFVLLATVYLQGAVGEVH